MNRVQQGIRDPGTHTDAWLITYADMITLLLCFFVIFYVILSSRKNGDEEPLAARALIPTVQDTRKMQSQQTLSQSDLKISMFNEPQVSRINLADEVAARIGKPLGAGAITARNAASAVATVQQSSQPMVGLDASPGATPIEDHSNTRNSTISERKGDRISTLEMSSSAFFGSGLADLTETGKSILRDLSVELKSSRCDGYDIVVEGYTDDIPIATPRFPSNWELSTARAAAVVHFFLDQGLPAQKLHAAGYADTRPKLPNRDADGNAIPENQVQNRRVIIRLEKIEQSD
jgi:flagellar motor protein MotB